MKLSGHRTRLLVASGVLATLALGLAAWSAASPKENAPRLSSYRNGFVAFKYPSGWSASVWKSSVLHVDPMVYVSTQPTGNPCRTIASFGSSATSCGWPIKRLEPGGVVIRWENKGYPGVSVTGFPGKSSRIDGRIAKLTTQHPGTCRSIGGDETISVAIARPLASNWTAVDACLRGPNLAEQERQVRALLGSTRFLAP